MKALIVTRVSGFLPQFEMNDVRILQEMGYEVHYAANFNTVVYGKDNSRLDGTGIIRHQVDFERLQSPLKLLKTYRQIRELIEKGEYDLIHVHMPMSAALVRPAAEAVRHRTGRKVPVLYTAHGLHFYTGAPLKNWIFYPVEKFLAPLTDRLILINREDYIRAKKHFRVRGKVEHIYGIGMDLNKFRGYIKKSWKAGGERQPLHGLSGTRPGELPEAVPDIRKKYNIPEDHIILISVGELTKRKNNIVILEAMKKFKNRPVTYLVCGSGPMENELKEYVKANGLGKNVRFAGFVENAYNILSQADCFVFPSLQEGLPVAVMEAMAVGLPVIATKIRGITDLIKNGRGGFLAEGWEPGEYAGLIKKMFFEKPVYSEIYKTENRDSADNKNRVRESGENKPGNYGVYIYKGEETREKMGRWNMHRIKKFSIDSVDREMRNIYASVYREYRAASERKRA